MNLVVKARHMDVTPAIKDYVEAKAAKLPRFYDNIQSVEVTLAPEADFLASEIIVTATHKNTFVATHQDKDLYASFDQCFHKMTEQLRRHKDRVRDRQVSPMGQAPQASESVEQAEQ